MTYKCKVCGSEWRVPECKDCGGEVYLIGGDKREERIKSTSSDTEKPKTQQQKNRRTS